MIGSPFRFRLERVRALRERREDLAKRELARALGKLSDSEGALTAASERLTLAQQEQRSAASAAGTSSGADLRASQAFLERVERQRSLGVEALKRSENEVADRGAALKEAAQEHQMIERLKQRHRAEYMRELTRREGAMLDEIAIDRFRRRTA